MPRLDEMVDIILKTLTPATNFDLMTLEDLKVRLGIADTDTSQDAQLQIYITEYSDIISKECNRIFAKEEMRETVRCLQPNRYFVSHWPVKEDDIETIETPRGSVIDPSTYEVEEDSGKIEFISGGQSEPIVVTYTGGYTLPDETPPALKAACEILIRDARMWAQRIAVSGIRSLSHKDSRVQFFDAAATMAKIGGVGPLSAVSDAVKSLLYHYMRFQV
jgi:Phage gp6-like head-tail connector protein